MTIGFKVASLKREYEKRLHPAARAVVVELSAFCEAMGFAPVVVTRIEDWQSGVDAIYKEPGHFSWHVAGEDGLVRAIDIRNRDWSEAEQVLIEAWLKRHWPGAEVMMHDVGKGNHLHLAIPGPWSTIRRLRRVLARRKAAA